MLLTGAADRDGTSNTQRGKAMAGQEKISTGQRRRMLRAAIWMSVIVSILLIPLIAMQFSDEVVWGPIDFVIAGGLLAAVATAYELAASRGTPLYRGAAGLALAAAFMLIWINGAAGVIGSEDDKANLMFGGVLGIALIGALIARFRAAGMAVAMLATAVAQALVGVIALTAGWGQDGASYPWDLVGLTGFFTAMWLLSALLFWKAVPREADVF